MIKWFVASDIHGSAQYCRQMLEAFEREKADRMLLLGEILYHGPRNDLPGKYDPKEVITLLNERKNDILCVRGNCDTEVDQMVLEFPIMAEYALIEAGERMVFATHGHHFHKKALPPLHDGDILLHGHTHVSALEQIGKIIYANPGSVSIPKENTPRGYILMEGEHLTWKTLDGTVYRTL